MGEGRGGGYIEFLLPSGPVGGGVRTGGLRQGQELSRQMDRLRAATTTRIDQVTFWGSTFFNVISGTAYSKVTLPH